MTAGHVAAQAAAEQADAIKAAINVLALSAGLPGPIAAACSLALTGAVVAAINATARDHLAARTVEIIDRR